VSGGRGTPEAGPARAAARELARAAAAPVLCAVAVIGLLSAWVGIGGAGTVSRVQLEVTSAKLPMSAGPGGTTAPYLTIRNFSGRPYELTAASSPDARRVTVRRRGPGGLVIPPHATVTFGPSGSDIELAGPRRLRAGELVPLTLVFGQAGRVTIESTVTRAGGPDLSTGPVFTP
jgi:copper(I)-binding protein